MNTPIVSKANNLCGVTITNNTLKKNTRKTKENLNDSI